MNELLEADFCLMECANGDDEYCMPRERGQKLGRVSAQVATGILLVAVMGNVQLKNFQPTLVRNHYDNTAFKEMMSHLQLEVYNIYLCLVLHSEEAKLLHAKCFILHDS